MMVMRSRRCLEMKRGAKEDVKVLIDGREEVGEEVGGACDHTLVLRSIVGSAIM